MDEYLGEFGCISGVHEYSLLCYVTLALLSQVLHRQRTIDIVERSRVDQTGDSEGVLLIYGPCGKSHIIAACRGTQYQSSM